MDVFGKVGAARLYRKDVLLEYFFPQKHWMSGLGFGLGVGYYLNPGTEITIEYNRLVLNQSQWRYVTSRNDYANSLFGGLSVGVSCHFV